MNVRASLLDNRVIVRSSHHTSTEFLELAEWLGPHGVSYSVGWSAWLDLIPEVIAAAGEVAPGVTDDGLAQVLESLVREAESRRA
jgi:hypothetical protein